MPTFPRTPSSGVEGLHLLLGVVPTVVTAAVAIHYSSFGSLREAIAALDADVSTRQQQLEKAVLAEQQEASRRRLKKVTVEIGEAAQIIRLSRAQCNKGRVECLEGAVESTRYMNKLNFR